MRVVFWANLHVRMALVHLVTRTYNFYHVFHSHEPVSSYCTDDFAFGGIDRVFVAMAVRSVRGTDDFFLIFILCLSFTYGRIVEYQRSSHVDTSPSQRASPLMPGPRLQT